MYGLLTLQELENPPEDDELYPIIGLDSNPVLDNDEKVVWQGTVSSLNTSRFHNKVWRRMYEVPEKCIMTVTNQRIVYVCEKFNKDSRMLGTGLVGSGIAVAYNVAAEHKETKKRRGKALVGHLRYEWPRNVITEFTKKWPISSYSVQLNCIEGSDAINIKFYMSKQDYETIAKVIAEQIAKFRHIAMPEVELLDNGTRVRFVLKDSERIQIAGH